MGLSRRRRGLGALEFGRNVTERTLARIGQRRRRNRAVALGLGLGYGDGVRDVVVLVALLASFATLLTIHVAIAVRLLLIRGRRLRGLAVLVLPPLAPWWAHELRWRKSTWLWLAAVVCYAGARAAAAVLV
jgi:hypothetical protein